MSSPSTPAPSATFASGVASGDVSQDQVVLWTRAGPPDSLASPAGPVEVRWWLRGEGVDRAGRVVASARTDHCVRIVATGLPAGTELAYGFTCGDDEVAGVTRTLPATAQELRFVVTCCSRWGWPGFEQYGRVVDERPAFVLHLGDYIYEIGESTPTGDVTDPPWECHTLDDYRRRYRQHRTHPALQRLHAEIPVIAVWDDHEVMDNAPDDEGVRRRLAGQQAWREWMPHRPAEWPGPLDRRASVGGLFDLALVDTRFGGREPADTEGPDVPGVPGGLLDPFQWRALARTVEASSAPFFVFANQVQVGPMTLGAVPALRLPPWRRLVNPDQWDGFPDDRDRLYDLLGRVAGRPVVLSGDLHSGWSRTLERDGHPVAHEFTSPSISGVSYAGAVRRTAFAPEAPVRRALRLLNRGIDHLELDRHGYLVCDVTPERFRTTFVYHDGRRHVVDLAAG